MAIHSQNTLPQDAVSASSNSTEAITQLLNVGLAFGQGNHQVEVLKNIDLSINAGDFICVLGSSGCGKTTLLRSLAGYQQPTQGLVLISGKPHTKPNADVGVVFQRPNLLPWLTIAKNVEFGPKMRGIAPLERRQRVSHYLALVGLEHAASLLPYQLSGGMQQRAAIARTLAADPKLILMDEPFGALDALTREAMQIHLKEIWERTRKTIFFITHDVEEAMLLSTRILVMHARPGRIVADIANPFSDRLQTETSVNLRLDREFIKMRERLVSSIREVEPVSVSR